jgi:hypothetical protein
MRYNYPVDPITLTPDQNEIANRAVGGSLFLHGPAGSGKTTAGVGRLLHLIESGVPAEQILILVPQRTLAFPYYEALQQPELPPGGQSSIVTLGGLGQRLVELFWPLVAPLAGFAYPNRPPTFLTLETAQYYLAQVVTPLIEEQAYFETIRLDRNRMLSQVLDNLNKAALVGFPYQEVGERLKAAWVGDATQHLVYDQAQDCAVRFRQFCLENNLLDFSLQLEVFTRHLWSSFICRNYLTHTYRHLIFDNVEEDTPVVHDILREWLPAFESALLIYDTEGGYRLFLGADPDSGLSLREACQEEIEFSGSLVTSPAVEVTRQAFQDAIHRRLPAEIDPEIRSTCEFVTARFIPEMAEDVADRIQQLVLEQGILPGKIAVLAPFMSDSLRFTLMNRLEKTGVPVRSHRPSRSLRDEPATTCLLTLARLAHPTWNLPRTSHFDVRFALMQSIEGLDMVRADLLARIVFQRSHPEAPLNSFDQIQSEKQERITFAFGERYEILRVWLVEYMHGEALDLDVFLSRLFGEVLSQPGFHFHRDFDAAGVTARLIESIQKFRRGTVVSSSSPVATGQEYMRMVEQGVVAAQYLQTWSEAPEDAVFLAPAYTFLMGNRPVDIQFWLDAGSMGWWERLYQPLTHPYVLSRRWQAAVHWTDAYEYEMNQANMGRLISGLLLRCRQKIYIYTSGYNEQGDNQRGPLLQAMQGIRRRLPPAEEVSHV